MGINTSDAEKMRKAATWYGVSPRLLTFIRIKELPQIKQSKINMDQLISLLFIKEGEGHKSE